MSKALLRNALLALIAEQFPGQSVPQIREQVEETDRRAFRRIGPAGCAGARPLKGGRAVTTHESAGVIEQTLVQAESLES